MSNTTLLRPDYRRAQNEATRLLNEAGIYQPPVNPLEIAKYVGLKVNFVEFTGESSEVSGLFDFKTDTILVNMDEAGVRQSFTIAHEIGHKVLHQEWAASDAYKVLWRDPSRQGTDRREQEANAFAASLLMPRQMVREYKNLDVRSMSRLFAVSEAVVTHRLNNLNTYGF